MTVDDSPTSDSHTRAYDADPTCTLCQGLGVRHVAMGLRTAREQCPCTLIGPELRGRVDISRYTTGQPIRALSEIPPIKDTAVLDAYPDCQPRTPIDPVARIVSPGLLRGNADLQPAMCRQKPVTRECPTCSGRGVLPRSPWAKESGDLLCTPCDGSGRVRL